MELSDWEFKIAMISMLRALIQQVNYNARTDGSCKQRNRNAKKKNKKDARNMPLMGSAVEMTQTKKEAMSLKVYH